MLSRAEITDGYLGELRGFAALVRSLDDGDLARPTRCSGWTVGDVVAHVAGGNADVVNFRLEGAGTPEWTNRQVQERKGRGRAELAAEIDEVVEQAGGLLAAFDDEAWNAPAPFDVAPSVGNGVEGLWYDTYVHADDVRAALGRSPEGGPGLRASVIHLAGLLADRKWGPAILALDGLEPIAVGDPDAAPADEIRGDAHQFVLAATGRADPAALGLDATVNVYG